MHASCSNCRCVVMSAFERSFKTRVQTMSCVQNVVDKANLKLEHNAIYHNLVDPRRCFLPRFHLVHFAALGVSSSVLRCAGRCAHRLHLAKYNVRV
jgi:hypothetical protein